MLGTIFLPTLYSEQEKSIEARQSESDKSINYIGKEVPSNDLLAKTLSSQYEIKRTYRIIGRFKISDNEYAIYYGIDGIHNGNRKEILRKLDNDLWIIDTDEEFIIVLK